MADDEIPKVVSYTEQRLSEGPEGGRASLALHLSYDLLQLMMESITLMSRLIDLARVTDPKSADDMEAIVRNMQGRIDSMVDHMSRDL